MNPENAEIKSPIPELNTKTVQNTKLAVSKDLQSKSKYLKLMRNIAGIFYAFGIISGVITGLVFLIFLLSSFRESGTLLWIMIAFGGVLQCFAMYCVLNALADIAENMVAVGSYIKELKTERK